MSISEYLALLARLATIESDIARIDTVLVALAQAARPAPAPTTTAAPAKRSHKKRILTKPPTRAVKPSAVDPVKTTLAETSPVRAE